MKIKAKTGDLALGIFSILGGIIILNLTELKNLLLFMLLGTGVLLLSDYLGLLTCLGLSVIAYLKIWGREKWIKSIVIGVCMVAFLYGVFVLFLHVPVPKGPLGF